MDDKVEKVDDGVNEALIKLRLQNYNPRTGSLKKYWKEQPAADDQLREISEAQENLIKATNRKFGDPALDLDNLVPRSSTWDIKRSLASKLELLEHRTQRAIFEMAQKKVRQERDISRGPEAPNLSSDEED